MYRGRNEGTHLAWEGMRQRKIWKDFEPVLLYLMPRKGFPCFCFSQASHLKYHNRWDLTWTSLPWCAKTRCDEAGSLKSTRRHNVRKPSYKCSAQATLWGSRSFALYTTCEGPAGYHVRARGSLPQVLVSLGCSSFAFVMKRKIGIFFILGWLVFKESSIGRDSIFHQANQCLQKSLLCIF